MLFKRRFHDGLRDGRITLSVRAWSRPQVKVGGRYPVHPIGEIVVDAVSTLQLGELGDAEARRSGFASREELIAELNKGSKRTLRKSSTVYRIALHYAGSAPVAGPALADQKALSRSDVDEITRKLDAMDRRSAHGSFTREILCLVEANPEVAAARLAPQLGREKLAFKTDVRKLKKLGLTISLETGYRLAPRGRAYLRAEHARRK